MERTAALAGLGPPSTPPPDPMFVGALVVSLIVALGSLLVLVGQVLIVYLLWRRSDAAAREPG